MIIMWILVGLLVNAVIGAGAWAAMDDENGRMFAWYKSAPNELIKFITLQAWPIGLYFGLKRK